MHNIETVSEFNCSSLTSTSHTACTSKLNFDVSCKCNPAAQVDLTRCTIASYNLAPRPFNYQWRGCGKQENTGGKSLMNSTIAQIQGCIPVVSVDEGKNAILANQIQILVVFCHDMSSLH